MKLVTASVLPFSINGSRFSEYGELVVPPGTAKIVVAIEESYDGPGIVHACFDASGNQIEAS